MRKRVSVKELKEYCERNKPKQVTYYSENQDWYRVSDPCKLRMHFPIMLICENPSLICLKSGTSTICFDRVCSVEIDTETTVLGTILTVYCGCSGAKEPEITYKLIAA